MAKETYESDKHVGAWNFGPYDTDILTVEEVVNLAIKNWGKGSYSIVKNMEEPHEAMNLKLDISKARHYLKWEPTYNSKKQLKTIHGIKIIMKDINMYEYTVKQIEEFENSL